MNNNNEEMITEIIEYYVDILKLQYITTKSLTESLIKSIKNVSLTKFELMNFIADDCASKTSRNPEYKQLASRICADNLMSIISDDFKLVITDLYNNVDKNGDHSPIISKDIYDIVNKYGNIIQREIKFDRDYNLDYFGLRTLERSYLFKLRHMKIEEDGQQKIIKVNKIIERPQHMFMRVALGIHGDKLDHVFKTYNLMSERYMIHATPTLFNSGTIRPQLSSCFLLTMEDSIEGIFSTITNVAKISKWAGGIGICLSDIRAKGSLIRKTNGLSDGIVPLCQLLGVEGKYVNQGGKRNGSISIYIEPWHYDIFEFCEMRKNTKDECNKARDLFLALWVPDLFMKRVLEDGKWSLMCPDECPGLTSSHGKQFEDLYTKYERECKYRKQVNAVDLWYHIMSCQIETGMPFFLYKDNANIKSNQKNLGTIKCSNLCTEIIEYTDAKTISVCNLASVCLPRFIETKIIDGKQLKSFNYEKLIDVVEVLVCNLDIIIDKNYYPVEDAKESNMKHRPIGIGVQGLADIFNIMRYPFGSHEARILNRKIFETIYYAAMRMSNTLAKRFGIYDSFKGSPASEGILQYHMWGLTEDNLLMDYDWKSLIDDIKLYGLRNSLLTTCMPTASTAQIMGSSEGIDPYLSNVFTRATLAGEFIVINENLIKQLIEERIWSEKIRNKIIISNGSIQTIDEIPQYIKEIYKTAFELKLKDIITLSAERGPYICQSQSLNLFMEKSNFDILTSAHFYSWESGLKTGMYYLHSRPSVDPIKFGIDATEIQSAEISQNKSKESIKESKSESLISNETEVKLCKWRPGIKISECTSCT